MRVVLVLGGDDACDGHKLVVGKAVLTVVGGEVAQQRAERDRADPAYSVAVAVHRVAAEIEPGRLLFERHLFKGRILLDIGYLYHRRGFLAVIGKVPEQVELAGDIVPLRLSDAVDYRTGDLYERAALIAHRVERARFDEVIDRAAVEFAPVHAAAEILKALEQAAALALGDEAVHRAPAHALDGNKAVADVRPADGEVRAGFVDVGRQQLYAHVAALGDVFGDLRTVFKHTRQQRCHVFGGIVPLHIGRAVGDDGVAHGVRLC